MRTLSNTTNAGPMADIAFLLLVFFLVATTMNGEKGIQRKMPSTEITTSKPHAKRNTLIVTINGNDKLMVDGELVSLPLLNKSVQDFVNNNGNGDCNYCKNAKRNENKSDHPTKALIGLDVQKGTSYNMYIKVQNEINDAFKQMRNVFALEHFGFNYDDLQPFAQKEIRSKYPLLLSEQVLTLN